ncbi:MAG: hypothetical protein J7513_16695, partial [Solirubrobacteraceae bacterium]|nr:hypothetical protein [Solirubrobacteraceae bacterium]
MLAILFLLVSSLAGFAVLTRLVPQAPMIVRLPGGFLLSVVFTSWTTYVVARIFASSSPEHALKIGLITSLVLSLGVLIVVGRKVRPQGWRIQPVDIALTAIGLLLSYWLMHAHLRNDNGELVVSANTWGDMGLHIALSRSFSVGSNYPTEYPFFAGEPIRYHFGFDFFAGMLQEGGLSVLWSFNLPGILGFTSMMLLTLAIGRLLFSAATPPAKWWHDKGTWVGLIAVALS